MVVGGFHVPSSPYYWVIVGALTVAFAIVDLEALRRREMTRWHGFAVAVYVTAWGLVLGWALQPWTPNIIWFLPAAVRIAIFVVLEGSEVLAAAVRKEQWIAHPERREPKYPPLEISDAQLHAAEEYDAEWQIEDRERNRRLGLDSEY